LWFCKQIYTAAEHTVAGLPVLQVRFRYSAVGSNAHAAVVWATIIQ
jgi:hypothetical protein